MNTTQITAIRDLWAAVNAPAITPEQTYTPREFELAVPHNMSRDGKIAKGLDGSKWVIDWDRRLWVRIG
jgi:hypothetical protein